MADFSDFLRRSRVSIVACNHATKLAYAFLQAQQLPPGVWLENMELGATRFEVILPSSQGLRLVVSYPVDTHMATGVVCGQTCLDLNHELVYAKNAGYDLSLPCFNDYESLLQEIKRVAALVATGSIAITNPSSLS